MISKFSPAAICIQETKLGDSAHVTPPRYRGFYSPPVPGQGPHGGAAVFVRADVPSIPLTLNSPLQAVAVKVFLDRCYTLCSIYLSPGDPVDKADLVQLAHELPQPFILLGDFNGRHPLWDSDAVNSRGRLMASFIEDEDLEVLNSGDVTYFHSPTGIFTAIDLSLCSSNVYLNFNWSVLPDLYGSDHFPILLQSVDSVPQSRPPRWRLDRADWHLFADLSVPARTVEEMPSCDEATQYFTDVLHSAAIRSVPRTSGRFAKRPVPWWNAACTEAVREKRAAFSRLQRHRGDQQCLEAFRRARARARRTLKQAQRDSWKAYVSSITARTPLTEVFNRVRKISGKFSPPPPPVLAHGGANVADPQLVARLFAEHFCGVSRRDPNSPGTAHRRSLESRGGSFPPGDGEPYNVPFSPSELRTALSQCHHTSPGPDDVPYAFLRHMSDNAFIFFTGSL